MKLLEAMRKINLMKFYFASFLLLGLLSACGGGGGGDAQAPQQPVSNTAPVANAGSAQNVMVGNSVTLDGTASVDANGDTISHTWVFISRPAGSTAVLSLPSSAKPVFTADVAGTYVISLIVNDGKINSAPSNVTVTAAFVNAAPVANAGSVQNVVAGTTVTLDGTASSDANGDALTYAWTLISKPTGSGAILALPNSVKPTFVADIAGTYTFSLVVNDGKIDSSAVTVAIEASTINAAPVANAGLAQNVVTGTLVVLDGAASSDADGDKLTYVWSLMTKPAGSSAFLNGFSSKWPSFTADVAGTYVFALVVNDGKVNSAVSTVAITASTINAAPVANAGRAQETFTGATVTLDGSASSDANGDALTYSWKLASRPVGSDAILLSPTSAKPTLMTDIPGIYVFALVVNDGKLDSAVANTTISVNTPVGGIISSDTTLTIDKSPYMLSAPVQVAYGKTLTVEPGVTVRSRQGQASSIDVFGTLDVHGTASSYVQLDSLSINTRGANPVASSAIKIRFARFNGGFLGAPTGNAGYGNIVLTDSVLIGVNAINYMYLWYPQKESYIERNIFKDSGGISVGVDSQGIPKKVYIRNNVFTGIKGVAIENWASYGGETTIVSGNSFLDTGKVILKLSGGYNGGAMTATGNFWGTVSQNEIQSRIYDKTNDLGSSDYIVFFPYLTQPAAETPSYP